MRAAFVLMAGVKKCGARNFMPVKRCAFFKMQGIINAVNRKTESAVHVFADIVKRISSYYGNFVFCKRVFFDNKMVNRYACSLSKNRTYRNGN